MKKDKSLTSSIVITKETHDLILAYAEKHGVIIGRWVDSVIKKELDQDDEGDTD